MPHKQKLVYILPEYREAIGTHLYHNYEFLERAKNDFGIFLVIEKGDKPRGFEHMYRMFFRFMPLRALELFFVLFWARVLGYKTFWTHYSFYGAIIAPVFGKSFYWNCGMPWLYKRGSVEEWIFRLALRRSLLVTGTPGMRQQYIGHYKLLPDHVRVMPNWISIARFQEWSTKKSEARQRLAVADDTKVVLFLHHVSKRKGADLIMPVAKVFEGDDSVLFLVAGSGPLEDAIQGINIRLVGEISQRDVPMYMAAADVFFMPSEEEGFPHVLLEAMVLGVPIVASDVGGVREIVPPELVNFVVPQDANVFAEKVKILLGDGALAQKISTEEKNWVEKYSLKQVLALFADIIVEKKI